MARPPRIFVQVASYRDPELPRTITNALGAAADPERLTFGICQQQDDDTADDLAPWRSDPRFRIDAVPHAESEGCCWARHRIGGLYDGETYTLQIDAHTRFAPGWDQRLITMLGRVDAERPLLTAYPKGYTRHDGRDVLDADTGIERLELVELKADLTTVLRGAPAPDPTVAGESHFIAAGMVFAPGRFCVDVRADPEMCFDGEEIALAVRAFTHGYSFHHPNENLLWHHYDHRAPLQWVDRPATHAAVHQRGLERLHTLLLGDAGALGEFGLGPVRTVADYEAYAGLDFAARHEEGADRHPVRFRRLVPLDIDAVPPRDDYLLWVFTLMGEDEVELFRRDLTDPQVLAGQSRIVQVDVELEDTPTHYLLWPKSTDGWGDRIVRPLPEVVA